MLYIGDKEIKLIYYGGKAISAIYHGARLVWQAVHSCFGGGGWNNDLPWDNNDGWVN